MNKLLTAMAIGFNMIAGANAVAQQEELRLISLPYSVKDGIQYQLFIDGRDTLLAETRYDTVALSGKGDPGTLDFEIYEAPDSAGVPTHEYIHDYNFNWKDQSFHAGDTDNCHKSIPQIQFIKRIRESCLIRKPDDEDRTQITEFCRETGNADPFTSFDAWIDMVEMGRRFCKQRNAKTGEAFGQNKMKY